MKKTDIHVHITEQETIQKNSQGTCQTGAKPSAAVLRLAGPLEMSSHMEALGIDQAIIMSAGEEHNEANCRICQKYPKRFRWMCNLDGKDAETVEDRLRRYQDMGAVGVGELMVNELLSHPFLEAVFHAAEKLKMPVLFHMSPEEKYHYGVVDLPGLPLLELALNNHPELIFIGHSQPFWHEISRDPSADLDSRNSWGKGPVTEGGRVEELLRKYPNLYGDLSANSGGQAIMRDEKFGLNFLNEFQDRLLFGTDMCNETMVFPLSEWMDQHYRSGDISKQAYEKIFYKNAEKVFHI